MDVEVINLTKKYQEQYAVDHISFASQGNEIIGFLGPNGAGKSTTMKMLTGYVRPTDGTASIAGYDVVNESEEVKKRVGYLPESNPLYYDMYVREFLGFVARAHQLSGIKTRVSEVIETVGLQREAHKKIRQLSKGYKQRVGIAQAIIHDPQVLIMDEPTSGLDANQLTEIRSLIKKLGKEKTILFSSHIMQEIEALCERVLIIDNGKLLLDSHVSNLPSISRGEETIYVEFQDNSVSLDQYMTVCEDIKPGENGSTLIFYQSGDQDIRPLIFNQAIKLGHVIIGMQKKRASIESIFHKMTKKS